MPGPHRTEIGGSDRNWSAFIGLRRFGAPPPLWQRVYLGLLGVDLDLPAVSAQDYWERDSAAWSQHIVDSAELAELDAVFRGH